MSNACRHIFLVPSATQQRSAAQKGSQRMPQSARLCSAASLMHASLSVCLASQRSSGATMTRLPLARGKNPGGKGGGVH
jgi:hypothetical protein